MKSSLIALSSVSLLSLAACGSISDGSAGDEIGSAADAASSANATFFIVTHPDYRKCMYPMCGGVFVKRVNQENTKCVGGDWSDECHAVAVDFSSLGLTTDEEDTIAGAFRAGTALVRGNLKKRADGFGNKVPTLVAKEAFVGAGETEPTGVFYRMSDSGIVCITTPCPSLQQKKLNSTEKPKNLDGLNLDGVGATDVEIGDGYVSLYDTGLLVAGASADTADGKVLSASEFYLPFVHKDEVECPGGGELCNLICSGQSLPELPQSCPIPMCKCVAPDANP